MQVLIQGSFEGSVKMSCEMTFEEVAILEGYHNYGIKELKERANAILRNYYLSLLKRDFTKFSPSFNIENMDVSLENPETSSITFDQGSRTTLAMLEVGDFFMFENGTKMNIVTNKRGPQLTYSPISYDEPVAKNSLPSYMRSLDKAISIYVNKFTPNFPKRMPF